MVQQKRKDKHTDRQSEAIEAMSYVDIPYTLLYGGARSGKSHVIIRKMVHRAATLPGSRYLVARERFSHAKTSIWKQTLVPMVREMMLMDDYTINNSECFIRFANNSEIWLAGFDDKERTEKILGTEYLDIYFNEVSQFSYDAIVIGLSRLAQKIMDKAGRIVPNKGYFDCNPPSPLHWAHKLFIEKKDPVSQKPLKHPELYNYLAMNPLDNLDNLPPNYIERSLDILPERARKRFKLGEWVKAEGTIYDFFDESMLVPYDDLPQMEYYSIGLDFGLNMAAILWGWCGDNLYCVDCHGAYNATTSTFNSEIDAKWGALISTPIKLSQDADRPDRPKEKRRAPVYRYCDPSGGERIQEVTFGEQADNAVEDGIDFLNTKMEHGQFFYTERASGFVGEILDYRRDDKERIIKVNDHFMDAGRYGAYSFTKPARLSEQKPKSKPLTAGMRNQRF